MSDAMGDGLVVCSLERWDEVWRRNQFFVDQLLRRDPALRVLFVEPAYDLVHGLLRRHRPPKRGPQPVPGVDRVWRLCPVKPLPRVLGPGSDAALRVQVRRAARALGLGSPTLWINDLSYAALASTSGWPTLYDITDDWLVEGSVPERVRRRRHHLERRLLRDAAEVVVCSPGLVASRSHTRAVTLIPNGVDVDHFTRPQARPADLGASPAAVYVGTLHDERFDVELVCELAVALPHLTITLVGPNALTEESTSALIALPNVRLLGPRPYDVVPGYLQHADVVIVPHRINDFTESLDPIKAYECLAVGRPTVATEVAGFRGLPHPVTTSARSDFAESLSSVLATGRPTVGALPADATWEARSLQFQDALYRSRLRAPWACPNEEDSHATHD